MMQDTNVKNCKCKIACLCNGIEELAKAMENPIRRALNGPGRTRQIFPSNIIVKELSSDDVVKRRLNDILKIKDVQKLLNKDRLTLIDGETIYL